MIVGALNDPFTTPSVIRHVLLRRDDQPTVSLNPRFRNADPPCCTESKSSYIAQRANAPLGMCRI